MGIEQVTPNAPAYQPPPAVASAGTVAPGKLWPPDRRVWAGGLVSGLVFTALSYLHAWTGVDLNLLNPLLSALWSIIAPNVSPPDVTALLSLAIGAAVAQYIPPSLRDTVAWLNNAAIRAANADPNSPVTAMIVSSAASAQVAKSDIAHGAVPADIVAKREVMP